MTETDTQGSWLTAEQLRDARDRLPILYVDAVPVRLDERGALTGIGLLLRATSEGAINHELVSGRVLYHERIRDALMRHLEKDLGPLAMPHIPVSPVPFTVAEYFPTPGITPFHDPRQHAVSLAFVVPVAGDCAPSRTRSTSRGSRPKRPAGSPRSARWRTATACSCVRRWPTSASRSEVSPPRGHGGSDPRRSSWATSCSRSRSRSSPLTGCAIRKLPASSLLVRSRNHQ